MRLLFPTAIFLLLVLPGPFPLPAAAAEPDPALQEDGGSLTEAPVLDPVTVVGRPPVETLTGRSQLDGESLRRLPSRDRTLNDHLVILPGIQVDESSDSSLTGGEILPPEISISGGKTHQNNFIIDGLGNNSYLDPQGGSPASATILPDRSQDVVLDPSLVERVTVYDNNVPAEYGGFTGGVVDVETRRPGPALGGSLRFRTTRDAWTELYVPVDDEEDFGESDDASMQPRFRKYDGGATLNLPLGSRYGLLASFQQAWSDIELKNLAEDRTQTRRNRNFFLKLGGSPDPDSYGAVTLLWAPYREERFRKNTHNGEFTLHGGGLRVGVEWEQDLSVGTWSVSGGFRQSRTERDAPRDLFGWNADSATKDWGQRIDYMFSFEGGVGDLENLQRSGELHTDLEGRRFKTGPVGHRIKAGLDLERVHARYRRPETTHIFFVITSLTPEVVCPEGSVGCIDGEQFFEKRQVFPATEATADLTLADLFLEDRLDWGRFELRPGLRISYDDFMDNLDLAPRLAASWDLFGDDRTVLLGGVNRYYGRTLAAYALREAIKPFPVLEQRELDPVTNEPGPWQTILSGTTAYRYSELDTPYSDEWTVGLNQALFGGRLDLRYVERDGHDEFAKERSAPDENGIAAYVLNNNGSSEYRSARLFWERFWTRHHLLFDVTWQEVETATEGYDTSLDLGDLETRIFYDGELLHVWELPWDNFNRPWVANLAYAGRLPWGVTFSNVTRFRGRYRTLDNSGEDTADGIDIYEEVERPSALTFDWMLSWRVPGLPPGQELALNLEVYNVFDKRVRVGSGNDEYETGRQFWLGGEYRF